MSNYDYTEERQRFGDSAGDRSGTNRQYRDRLFKAIFGSQERRNLTLQLYNAVNESSYTDPEAIEISTIGDVVYMGMKNDVSFLLGQVMNLWEQQSTPNRNMPLRFMLYYAHVMESYVNSLDPKSGSIYANTAIRLPTPRMVLFYNGPGTMPEYMYLSDAFADGTDPDVQLRVRVINIHSGQGGILEHCRPLMDYTTFVEAFHRYRSQDGVSDREAASRAIRELPDGDVRDYLRAHESEVLDMLLTEYDEEKTMKAIYYEGEKAGLERGLEQGLERGRAEEQENSLRRICKHVANYRLSIAEALEDATDYGITSEADLRNRAIELGIQLPE